jgi:hypothetical protein
MHGQVGEVIVTQAETAGCPKTSPGKKGFVYPNGSIYSPVGTTCYAWVHQDENGAEGDPDTLETNTLASLKLSPFNKVSSLHMPAYTPAAQKNPAHLILRTACRSA